MRYRRDMGNGGTARGCAAVSGVQSLAGVQYLYVVLGLDSVVECVYERTGEDSGKVLSDEERAERSAGGGKKR